MVYGGVSAPGANGVLALSALDGANGFTLTGIDPDDRSGVSVSSAGDVNGDGYDDLIIGVQEGQPNGERSLARPMWSMAGRMRRARMACSHCRRWTARTALPSSGSTRRDRSGRAVSSAGDVNGDGYDDLVIGADGADPNGASLSARPMWSMAGRVRRARMACWLCLRWTARTALPSRDRPG